MADIPGLIEGAGEGKGLGHAFLRHIKRTRTILHCVSVEHDDVAATYRTIRRELSRYDEIMLQKPEIVFLTKVDEISSDVVTEKIKTLEREGVAVIPVSILDDRLVAEAQKKLAAFLQNL